MKKLFVVLTVLFTCFISGQTKDNPLIILDSKNIGYMNQAEKTLQRINPDDVILSIYKASSDEIFQKFGSKSGVLIYTTKKYILHTFFKNNIENSPIKKDIPTIDRLSKIGVVGSVADNKDLPYAELIRYINATSINEELKIASISFIEPSVAVKMNPNWKFGAIEIMSTQDR